MLECVKPAIGNAFARLVCPITHTLPTDPVIASDGKVYERWAITTWIDSVGLRSPFGGASLGTVLVPADNIKALLRTMVSSGALMSWETSEWQKRIFQETQDSLRLDRIFQAQHNVTMSLESVSAGGC